MSEAGQNIRAEPLSKDRLHAWLRLLSAHKRIERRLRKKLRLHNSTLPHFDVLAALNRHRNSLHISKLSAKLKVSNGNVTGIVDRLVSKKLVERETVQSNQRTTQAHLTEKSRARFTTMAAKHEAWIDKLFAKLNRQELDHMATLLGKIRKNTA